MTSKKPDKRIKALIKKIKAMIQDTKIKRDKKYPGEQIMIPILLDGVMDAVLWDHAKQKFTELHLRMNVSKKEVYQHFIFKNSCHTDKIMTMVIDLETEKIIREEKRFLKGE